MSFDIQTIVQDLEAGALEAAKTAGEAFLKEASADAIAFVKAILPAMGRYIDLLITKQINEDEFKSLMLGLKDLAEMAGLTAAGLAAVEVDKTKNSLLKIVTAVAVGAASKSII